VLLLVLGCEQLLRLDSEVVVFAVPGECAICIDEVLAAALAAIVVAKYLVVVHSIFLLFRELDDDKDVVRIARVL